MTEIAWQCIYAITRLKNMQMDESDHNLSVPVKPSYCEPSMPTLFSFGESLLMTVGNKALTVQCSEMKAGIKAVSLSDRRTESLISAGLVKGIIPTSMRKRSGQQILDIAFFEQVGDDAGKLKTD